MPDRKRPKRSESEIPSIVDGALAGANDPERSDLGRRIESDLNSVDPHTCEKLAREAEALVCSYRKRAVRYEQRLSPSELGTRYKSVAAALRKAKDKIRREISRPYYVMSPAEMVVEFDSLLDTIKQLGRMEQIYTYISSLPEALEAESIRDFRLVRGGQRGPLTGWLWPKLMWAWVERDLPLKKADTGLFSRFLAVIHETFDLGVIEPSTVFAIMDEFQSLPPDFFRPAVPDEVLDAFLEQFALERRARLSKSSDFQDENS